MANKDGSCRICRRILLASILMLTGPGSTTARGEAFTPVDGDTVLEQLPTPGDANRRGLRRLRAQLSADPHNLELATTLAQRYVRLARAESDPRYNGYAQAALAPWWKLRNAPIDVLVLRATLLQNRHEFEAALADLARVLALDPRHAQARLTHAVILQVQGKPREAMASCLRLQGLADALVRAACLSSAASQAGRAEQAYLHLDKALQRAPTVDPTMRTWVCTILAEIAASIGRDADAERHFRAALDTNVRDVYLLAAYADFLLDLGRERDVVALLASEIRADGLLLRLALAENRLRSARAAEHVQALQARFESNRRRGDNVHLRAEARFTLHLLAHPERALELALANWRVQREPWDARLVLEAAVAAESPDDAAPVIAWLRASGLEDVRIARLADALSRESS